MRGEKRGFTLVELLVVIAIIGVLVALLLPAIQMARESSRRTQCGSNLKQIGLAFQNYHDTYKKFPFGATCVANQCATTSNFRDAAPTFWSTTWATALLPYMEQQALWDMWDPKSGYGGTNQRLVTGAPLQVMHCPSDLSIPPTVDPDSNAGTFDRGNYGLNFGAGSSNENGNSGNKAGPDDAPSWTTAAYGQISKNRGFASLRDTTGLPSNVGLNDVLDGTSNTVIVGEMLHMNKSDDCRGCWGKALGSAVSAYTRGNPETDGPNGVATPNVRAVGNYRDAPPHCSETASIGDIQLECQGSSGDGLGGNAMRSRHPGGVQALFTDGHVVFLRSSIDKIAYRALMSIQGSESVSNY